MAKHKLLKWQRVYTLGFVPFWLTKVFKGMLCSGSRGNLYSKTYQLETTILICSKKFCQKFRQDTEDTAFLHSRIFRTQLERLKSCRNDSMAGV